MGIRGIQGHFGPTCIFSCVISVPLLTWAMVQMRDGYTLYAAAIVMTNILLIICAAAKAVQLYKRECLEETELAKKQEILEEALRDDPPPYDLVIQSPPPYTLINMPPGYPMKGSLEECGVHAPKR